MAFKIKRFIPASPLTMPDPDPKNPKDSKRKADREAAKDPKRKYGKTTVKKDKDEYGFNRVTVSQPYTTSTGGKKTGKSYKQLEKEGGDVDAAKKFNAEKSGTRTKTFTYGNAKPAGVQISAKTPKPKIDLSKKPSSPKNNKGYFYENKVVMEFGGHQTTGRRSDLASIQKGSRTSFRPVTDREDQLMKSKFYSEKINPYSDGEKKFEQHLQNIETFEKRKNDKKFARKKITDKRNTELNTKRKVLKAKQENARAKKKK